VGADHVLARHHPAFTTRVQSTPRSGRSLVTALKMSRRRLEADLSFEYMITAEAELWQFAGRCIVDRSTDHSVEFIRRYAREPLETIAAFRLNSSQ
jgi:hypothetical protein